MGKVTVFCARCEKETILEGTFEKCQNPDCDYFNKKCPVTLDLAFEMRNRIVLNENNA